MIRNLIVADAHVTANSDLTRFHKLGRLLVDRKPDNLIFLGDFGSFESLSAWDESKLLLMEGRRYQEEIDTMNLALDIVAGHLAECQERQRRTKAKMYRPNFYFFEGNHEARVASYVEQHPEMSNFMNVQSNLCLSERGITFISYRGGLSFGGTHYCHIPMAKNNQPLSGKYALHRALERYNNSIVMGHIHRFELVSDRRIDASHSHFALSCGCFFEETPQYAVGAYATTSSGRNPFVNQVNSYYNT